MQKVLKQQASELDAYIKRRHTQEECTGFIDGFERANELFALYSVVVPKGTLPYPYKHKLEIIAVIVTYGNFILAQNSESNGVFIFHMTSAFISLVIWGILLWREK